MKQELYSIDSKKWDMLLDLLERPESYSETQKAELLGDEEMNEIYQQMVETRQAFDFDKSNEEMKMPSVDTEWKKLKEEKPMVISSIFRSFRGSFVLAKSSFMVGIVSKLMYTVLSKHILPNFFNAHDLPT